jgi:hypothetical protein
MNSEPEQRPRKRHGGTEKQVRRCGGWTQGAQGLNSSGQRWSNSVMHKDAQTDPTPQPCRETKMEIHQDGPSLMYPWLHLPDLLSLIPTERWDNPGARWQIRH